MISGFEHYLAIFKDLKMKYLTLKYAILGLLMLILSLSSAAQTKRPRTTTKTKTTKPAAAAAGVLTNDEIAFGLRDALSNGVLHATEQLGKQGGFYDNLRVKIPMPKQLQPVEKTLRFLKQDDLVDDFILSMNRAAEQSMREVIYILGDAIRQMTIQDAVNILRGPDDAATQFFRRTSEEKLRVKFLPIIKTSTEEIGVTAQYKELMKKAGPAASLMGQKDFDLDAYVTQKALDGLFIVIADEEKRIRENPLARTTSILKKVFGSIIK